MGVCVVNLILAWCHDIMPPEQKVMATAVAGQTFVPAEQHLEASAKKAAANRKTIEPIYKNTAIAPTHTMNDVIGMDDVKKRMLEAGFEAARAGDVLAKAELGSICFSCQIRNAGNEHWRGVSWLSH